jgi:hypothetical protein
LAYSFHGEGLLVDSFPTTILSGFPRLFYPHQGFWNRLVWENVEKNVAEEAAKLYVESKNVDTFLIQHNCKRFWGHKSV